MLFVEANQESFFRPDKPQDRIGPKHIKKIVEAYRAFEDIDRFAHVASLDEIRANGFNLNISRYVDTTEAVEVMSVDQALAKVREAEGRRDDEAARMDQLLSEMGYRR